MMPGYYAVMDDAARWTSEAQNVVTVEAIEATLLFILGHAEQIP